MTLAPLLAGALVALAPQGGPPVHHLGRVSLEQPATVRALHDAGIALDCQSRDATGRAEIVATDAQLATLQRRGVLVEVVQRDLEAFYAARLAAGRGGGGSSRGSGIDWDGGSMGGYFTFAEMEALLDQIAAVNPAICSAKFSLGQSVEGRELWAIKVSDHVATDESEPEVRFDAVHHAREPVSLHMTLYFLDWLVSNYGSDPLATHLVDEREIWLVPCVNPDGYEYNRATNPGGGGMWRKNRRDNGNGTFGVDLNRNYSYQWGYDNSGSSGNTSSETYRGPSPTSEPETQAMEAFIASRDFKTSISAHTYSNLWLFPWGYTCADPPNLAEFEGMAEWYTETNGYVRGPICQALYSANGDTVDYDFGVHGTWSGTVEIGNDSDGFWPPTSRIEPLLQENLRGWQRIALDAGAALENGDWSWSESNGDGDAWLEPGEERALAVTLDNVGTLATNGAATISIASSHADLLIVDGFHDFGTIAAFGSANNGSAPLLVRAAAGAAPGTRATVTLDLAYDGWVETRAFDFVIGEPSLLDVDDLEVDLGWQTGVAGDTATSGAFELADPQLTTSGGQTSQPADDHTAAGTLCAVTDGRAGSGAGTYDVDNGTTTLVSPEFDLEDVGAPTVRYWRFVTDLTVADDDFAVDLSNDGGATWVAVESVHGNANAWTQFAFDPTLLLPATDRMRLRWRCGDAPNNSLREALVDDLDFQGFAATPVSLWRYGTPAQGGVVRLHVQGATNLPFVLYGAQGGAAIPLKNLGLLELDPLSLISIVSGTTGGSGRFTIDGDIPIDPTISGVEIHLQALILDPSGAWLTNAVDFVIE